MVTSGSYAALVLVPEPIRVIIEGQMDLHLDLEARGSLRARCEHALRGAVRRLPAGRAAAADAGAGGGARRLARRGRRGLRAARRRGLPAHAPGRRNVRRAQLAARTPTPAATRTRDLRRPPPYDLRPALPALDGAFRPAWARALNRALRTTPDARLGYPDPRGEPELREALAASLARRRGVQASADEVRHHRRARPGLPFLWRLLAARGVRRVAIEDPCWPRLTATLTSAGLEPVPLGGRRARPATSPTSSDVGAAFVTPAHQYPTGAVLSPERRAG